MVKRLLDETPNDGQRLLFSATLKGGVDQIVNRYLSNPVSHAVATEAPVQAEHHVFVIDNDDRVTVVADLARHQRVVVFTRTKHRAKQLAKRLAGIGLPTVELHGNLSQNARTANLEAFASGAARALVATDIAARGIHVDDVGLVIHADPPMEHKAYLHRSGRTARAGAEGTVVTLSASDQISAVRTLLRQASITASWSTLAQGGTNAVAALSNKAGAAPAPNTGERAAAGRNAAPAGRGGGRGRNVSNAKPDSLDRPAGPDWQPRKKPSRIQARRPR
jgi:superfamily II DNA/RNA helicase